jgi:hypothetical protein
MQLRSVIFAVGSCRTNRFTASIVMVGCDCDRLHHIQGLTDRRRNIELGPVNA